MSKASRSTAPSSACRLLLGSGGFSSVPRGMKFLARGIDTFLGDDVKKVLLIPYAVQDAKKPLAGIKKFGLFSGRKVVSITAVRDPKKAVQEAQAILVWGGNTFRLLNRLYENDLLDVIRQRVRNGMPYIGVSAGTNVSAPTIMTTNDMPIIAPPSLEALGLIPFQINPHYFSGAIYKKMGRKFVRYGGETRDDRINEFHQMNSTHVIGIPEGTFLSVEGDSAVMLSPTPITARFFRRGKKPMDIRSGKDISKILFSKPGGGN